MQSIVLAIVVIAVAAVLAKVVLRGRDDAKFTIEVSGPGIDGLKMTGAAPGRSAGEILDFVARLELPRGAKLWGVADRGRLRLHFGSGVPEHLQQRLRNFFYN
jgi:hypothetical protein